VSEREDMGSGFDFDDELRREMSVSPSPEFVAKVRQRLASEPPAIASFGAVRLALAYASVAAIAIVAVLGLRQPSADVSSPVAAAQRTTDIALMATESTSPTGPIAAVRALPATSHRPVRRHIDEVLIAPGEKQAFEQFVATANSGKTMIVFEGARADTPTDAVADLLIPPIRIEPMQSVLPAEGAQ